MPHRGLLPVSPEEAHLKAASVLCHLERRAPEQMEAVAKLKNLAWAEVAAKRALLAVYPKVPVQIPGREAQHQKPHQSLPELHREIPWFSRQDPQAFHLAAGSEVHMKSQALALVWMVPPEQVLLQVAE